MVNVRKPIFWGKDYFFGSVRKQYDDIANALEGGFSEESVSAKLDDLLAHAETSVPYYKEIDVEPSGVSIGDFPVVDKLKIKQDYVAFLSQAKDLGKLHTMSTSGSTGTPFQILQDKRKRERVVAELIYFNKIAGLEVGDRFIYFRVWRNNDKKAMLNRAVKNMVCIDVLSLSEEMLQRSMDKISNDRHVKCCFGYATAFEFLCNHVEKTKGRLEPAGLRSIITSSEVLPLEFKKRVGRALGCKVYDRYSNQESGVIAQTDDCSDIFKVNHSNYLVEVLNQEGDEPADEGEVGRIVVTDLYNFAMPLIRYDTGDLAIKVGSGRFSEYMKSIQGRQADILYDVTGAPITPHTWGVYMKKFKNVVQYQLIQEDVKKYRLKVSGVMGIYSDDDFLSVIQPLLGREARIVIEHVDSVPVLASGKFKRTVCKLNNRATQADTNGD